MAVPSTWGPKSLKEYLKRYESNGEEELQKKKRKKKVESKPDARGVLVVDEDPVWQKPVNLEEENDDSAGASLPPDLSPLRKSRKDAAVKEQPKTGLVSGQDISEEIARTKKNDLLRFNEMDPSISGRGAEPVYRDRIKGERISKEEFLKSRQKVKAEEKPKEVKLEWGKGLAQKREAEVRLQELELEKDKPFARTRDDPELDNMMKERLRWGDPMAHLVKKKHPELNLPNLGDSEKMKESGFIIPQDIPNHSWLKRGLDAAPNRYGIRPGRHWDGVDRSNGQFTFFIVLSDVSYLLFQEAMETYTKETKKDLQLAFQLASTLKLNRVIIEGDSQIVISDLSQPGLTQDWRIHPFIINIIDSIPTNLLWKARKINRSANFSAHSVAHWAAARSFSSSIPTPSLLPPIVRVLLFLKI